MATKEEKTNSLSSTALFFYEKSTSILLVLFLVLSLFSVEPSSWGAAPEKEKKGKSGSHSGTKFVLSGKYIHISCSKSIRDLTNNKLECFGNVYIRRPSELLTSDYAILDMTTEVLHAEGNVVYFSATSVIYGKVMDFDLNANTGSVLDGRVENDKFEILGEKIVRVEPNHYIVTDGEYTTCRDCPASWKLMGKHVDLTVDGYAFLRSVYIKINEAPSLYLPYVIIPVKTKRQTGLLFPKIQPTSPNGFTFIQPFFWAINDQMDATIRGGFYTLRGPKGEFEYRYAFGDRTNGELRSFYLKDKTLQRGGTENSEEGSARWAIDYRHQWALPLGIDNRLSYIDVSDRDYVRKVGDLPDSAYEPALVSKASLSKSTRTASVIAQAKRVRNLLTPDLAGFDKDAVHIAPQISLISTDHQVFKDFGLSWGLSANYTRFWRLGRSFDGIYPDSYTGSQTDVFLPGKNPIRRADRYNIVPELYYTTNLFDVIDFIPSVKYRSYFYRFDKDLAGPTTRGYLQSQAEVGTNIERVYGNVVKHKFRPSLIYSNIPMIQEDESHAFNQQIKYSGYQFDDYDIVPISTETPQYFTPQGNSLSYRLSNRFIRKERDINTGEIVYQRFLDVLSGQTVNFIELKKSRGDQRPLSRFFTLVNVNTLRVQGNGEFYYYPYDNKPTYNISAKYLFAKYTKRFLGFERSLQLSYAVDQVLANSKSIGGGFYWSFNDYISINGGITYRFPSDSRGSIESEPGRVYGWHAGTLYQSPSQCFRFMFDASWTIENRDKVTITAQFPINLTGDGFVNFLDGNGGGFAQGGQ